MRRSLAATLVLLASCRSEPRAAVRPDTLPLTTAADSTPSSGGPGTIDDARMEVQGLRIDMPEWAVQQALGKPTQTAAPRFNKLVGDTMIDWEYPGIFVTFDDQRVFSVVCGAESCATPDSVRVGTPRADVLATYGPPAADPESGDTVLKYVARRHTACWLEFGLAAQRVRTISILCSSD